MTGIVEGAGSLLRLDFFGDESHDEKRERVLTLAGILGPRFAWEFAAPAWLSVLKGEGIRTFHATECEGRQREFRNWPRERVDAFQRSLVAAITSPAFDFVTYSCSLDLEAYIKVQPRLKKILKFPNGLSVSGQLDDPYFVLFQQLVSLVADDEWFSALADDTGGINFVFDQHRFGFRARIIAAAMSTYRSYGRRIRDATFLDKKDSIPLQIADFVAYETYRYQSGTGINPGAARWQYMALKARMRKEVFFDADFLERFVSLNEAKVAAKGQADH